MRRNLHRTLWIALLFSATCVLRAQPVPDQAPHLTVHTLSDQRTFHIGERIPLLLSFTGPTDKSFAIDLANYDRSGRMVSDTFKVEPESGWVDPLAAYFRYGSYLGGGIRGGEYLSSKSITVNANLNEWVRFDQPGKYQLTVTSHRVGLSRKDHPFPHDNLNLVASNSVTLIIIPATPAWQDATLSRILHDLPQPRKNNDESSELPEVQRNAISDLRFLGTTASARVLATQLRDDGTRASEAYFGLIGLPQGAHEQALRSMRSVSNEPDFPVSTMFLEAMSWLQMPDEDGATPPASMDKRAGELYEQKRSQARDIEWENIVLGLHEKKGAALHATETTLLQTRPLHPDSHSEALLGELIRTSFPEMSPAEQTEALENHWDLIESRALLSQLREIATAPPAAPDPRQFFFSPQTRIAVALRRWYELEPKSAAAEAIHQIGHAYPQLYARDVDYLRDESFPQFESLWSRTLAEGDDINDYEPAASLLLRFGTGNVSAQMVEIISHPKDRLGNRSQPALAYLLKFDPRAANALLQLEPHLLIGSLDSIAKNTSPSKVLTDYALRQIAGSDTVAAADALNYLGHYGDEHVREPIYKAFLLWSERNKELANKDLHELSPDRVEQLNLGDSFVAALLGNQGWIPDTQLVANVRLHTIGANMQASAENMSQQNLQVTVFEGTYASYEIGHFRAPDMKRFEEKIDQFPAGTNFTLEHVWCPNQHSQDQLEADLSGLFLKHGMKLTSRNSSGLTDK